VGNAATASAKGVSMITPYKVEIVPTLVNVINLLKEKQSRKNKKQHLRIPE